MDISAHGRTTRKAGFLIEMDAPVPWQALCELIESRYPEVYVVDEGCCLKFDAAGLFGTEVDFAPCEGIPNWADHVVSEPFTFTYPVWWSPGFALFKSAKPLVGLGEFPVAFQCSLPNR